MDLKSIGKTIGVVMMWVAIYYLLSPVLMSHPILGWVILLAIVVTHDIW